MKKFNVFAGFLLCFFVFVQFCAVVEGASGDVINVDRKIYYDLSSGNHNALSSLVEDLKANPHHKFLKKVGNAFVCPNEYLNAQNMTVISMAQNANVNIQDSNALKNFIRQNATHLLSAIENARAQVQRTSIQLSEYRDYLGRGADQIVAKDPQSGQNPTQEKGGFSNIQLQSFPLTANVTLYTVQVRVSKDVFMVKVNDMHMHYEGNYVFSLATSSFTPNQQISFKAYNMSNQLIYEEQFTVR